MNHKHKIKLARRLRSHAELIQGKSIFDTKRWNERKEAIRLRVERHQRVAHERAVKRREAAQALKQTAQ